MNVFRLKCLAAIVGRAPKTLTAILTRSASRMGRSNPPGCFSMTAGGCLMKSSCFLIASTIVFAAAPAFAGTVFTTDFTNPTLHPELQDVDSAYTISGGVLSRTAYDASGTRRYVRTVAADYFSASSDYVFEVSFTTPWSTIQFIGIGSGVRGSSYSEPANGSLNFRIHSPDIASGRVDWAYNFGGGGDTVFVSTIGTLSSFGTHRARIATSGNVLTLAIDENYAGAFTPSFSTTIDLNSYPAIVAALNAESRYFFGTSDASVLYDDVMVGLASPSAIPEIDPAGLGSVLALVTGSLGLLERRRRARR